MKRLMKNEVLEKLKECKVQGRYSGRITDIHKGCLLYTSGSTMLRGCKNAGNYLKWCI